MKRNAKSRGSGGRLRLTLLLATAAAFLLVPAVSASAAEVHIIIEGTGAGTVKGVPPLDGTLPINCTYASPGPKTGACDAAMNTSEGLEGEKVLEEAAPGSEFAGWTSEGGLPLGCEPQPSLAPECGVLSFGGPVTIKAKFNLEPPKFKLNVTKNGTGSGTVTSAPAGISCGVDCEENYTASTLVKLTGAPSTGSKPVVWESCPGTVNGSNECEVTMSAAKEAKATFDLIPESFSTTVEGEGKVECEDNGGGLGPCAASYLYGHTIKVVATAVVGNKLKEISGTGSASGCTASPCSFEIEAPSSIEAVFKSEKVEDKKTANVEGEVPQTTTLESTCGTVKLGEFKPGVPADYYKACGLTLTTTGEKTTLTASDGSALHTGHLVQEYGPNHLGPNSYFLPSPLDMAAHDSEAKGTSTGVKQLETPAILLEFDKPVSKDATTLEFNQHIGEHDGLHTNVYSKLITLTLAQTTP